MEWMRDKALGIYISIPFCRSKCTYCNFASGVYPASDHALYVNRLVEDLAQAGEWAAGMGVDLPRQVDTIYLGGGTPSLLAPELIERLFAGLRKEFDVEREAEITVECAPGQLAQPTLNAMVTAGVNRVSLGVQSFIDKEAHESGRLHGRAVVLADLERLRAAGILNVNMDLIAGLAGQTLASWEESLGVLVGCGVPHASVYMLEVDEDSRLGREMLAGGMRYHAGLVPSDDTIARMYETAVERLAGAWLDQYEISNFARPGYESRHNLRYWKRRAYLGVGLDASSMLEGRNGDVLRAKTSDDLKAYLSRNEWVDTEWEGPERQHEEAWFLGLRTNAGVEIAELEQEFGSAMVTPARQTAARLVQAELLDFKDGWYRLTPHGRLLSNDVFQEFLAEPASAVQRA
ncbi:MAG TPA: radical SAM family heme chaperone HemW [Terracidiphilus sp.]|jgi:oxygen-independent coproporphyrinogen-3 oxidase|nr:radical SAM family heme chaperone HemW [Terracidiphilus sp.]